MYSNNINDENPNTFVISLDAIDLNYLPTSFNRSYHKKVTPIWTKGNLDLRDDEYFEFEIKNKDDTQSVSEDEVSNEPIDYMTCHICDIEVPKLYLQEHYMSIKHKTHQKVIEIALSRIRNNVNHVEVIQNNKQNRQTYFCTSCVAIIKLEDRKEHETSVIHKNSVLVDKLLHDFLMIYSNNDCHDVDKTESCVQSTVGIDNEKNNNSENVLSQNSNISDSASTVSDIKQLPKLSILESNGYLDINNMKRFIEVMNKTHCTKVDITAIDNTNLEIITLEGSCVKVLSENFLGLKKINANYLQCLLCQEVVQSMSKEQHIYDDLHMKNVATPFKDKNCVRSIDLAWSHCVICNFIIENTDRHVLCNEEHIRLLQKALVTSVQFNEKTFPLLPYQNNPKNVNSSKPDNVITNETLWSNKVTSNRVPVSVEEVKRKEVVNDLKLIKPENSVDTKNDKLYCVICEIDILPENLKVHMKSMRHKINTDIKDLDVHYLMEIVNEEELKCWICHSSVKNNSAAVQRHLVSNKHVKLYNKLLSDNNLKDLKNCRFFCTICKVQVFKMDELCHINDELHMEKLKEATQTDTILTNVVNSDDKKTLEDDKRYLCVVCNLYMPNTESCILVHNRGSRHLKNISQIKPLLGETVSSNGSSQNNLQHNLFDVHYHMTLSKQSNCLICLVCDVNVTLSERNMYEHVKGNNHSINYKSILENNNILSFENNFFCVICSVIIEEKQELTHCKGKKHLKSLESYEKSICTDQMPEITETSISTKNVTTGVDDNSEDSSVILKPAAKAHIDEPSTSTKIITNTKEVLKRYLLKPTESPNTLQCVVCNVKVPNNENNIATYLRGYNHSNKYKVLLNKNGIKELDVDFKCDFCDVIFEGGEGSEIDHINSVHHEFIVYHNNLVKKSENMYTCSVCNVKLTNNETNITEHNTGSHHILMNKTFTENNLTVKDGEIYCASCEITFPQSNLSDHIKTKKHLFLVLSYRC